MYEDLLLQVRKPAQYIGREWNVAAKDFTGARIKFALAFPDLYEIGMSNLGMRIIYGLLNAVPEVVCERFFSVDSDMEQALRLQKRELLSLESRKRMGDFDILGFSLGSELDYTNILNMLELGGIPLRSSMRGKQFPLVIAGGPCALNPEPMHDFFDLFVIGEAEDVLPKILNIYAQASEDYKSGKTGKDELLAVLEKINGIYIPSFYEVSYNQEGGVIKFRSKRKGIKPRVSKEFVKNLDDGYYPAQWLVPHVQIVHDRMAVEVMRGCPNRCRFCQARSQYFPLRLRSPQKIKSLAEDIFRHTGYEELSLLGLSVGDYPDLKGLLSELITLFKDRGVGLSLPSLKSRSLLGNISSLIAKVKKTGLTFAPEAGSEKLRGVLGKDFRCEEFFDVLREAYLAGYQHIKLYFMIGIPNETREDLDAIIDFCLKVSKIRKDLGLPFAQVNVSVNNLIPKPHTALQWASMESLGGIIDKQRYLKERQTGISA